MRLTGAAICRQIGMLPGCATDGAIGHRMRCRAGRGYLHMPERDSPPRGVQRVWRDALLIGRNSLQHGRSSCGWTRHDDAPGTLQWMHTPVHTRHEKCCSDWTRQRVAYPRKSRSGQCFFFSAHFCWRTAPAGRKSQNPEERPRRGMRMRPPDAGAKPQRI